MTPDEMPPTQMIVDNVVRLAENWIRADADRRRAGRPPSDYEPEGADLSAYVRGALRGYGQECARLAREEAARICDQAAATKQGHAERELGDQEFAIAQVLTWKADGARDCAAAIRLQDKG